MPQPFPESEVLRAYAFRASISGFDPIRNPSLRPRLEEADHKSPRYSLAKPGMFALGSTLFRGDRRQREAIGRARTER